MAARSTRASEASTGSASATAGSSTRRRLPAGSAVRVAPSRPSAQPGASAAAPYSSMMPSQNDGTVMPAIDEQPHRQSAGRRTQRRHGAAQRQRRAPRAAAGRARSVPTVTPAAAGDLRPAPAGRWSGWCRNRRAARGRSRCMYCRTNELIEAELVAQRRRSRSGVTSALAPSMSCTASPGISRIIRKRQHRDAEAETRRAEVGQPRASAVARITCADLVVPQRRAASGSAIGSKPMTSSRDRGEQRAVGEVSDRARAGQDLAAPGRTASCALAGSARRARRSAACRVSGWNI